MYGYGVVGARLRGQPDEAAARRSYTRHTARRDRVAALIVAAGDTPVPAAPAYNLGGPVTAADQARRLAAEVEAALVAPYLDLVAATEGRERSAPAAWASEAASQSVFWGAEPTPFPGLSNQA